MQLKEGSVIGGKKETVDLKEISQVGIKDFANSNSVRKLLV